VPERALAQLPAPQAIPVQVAKPLAKRITRWDEYSGRFAAVNTVEVRARVSGFIDKISFRDGQLVKEGDLLFTLDQRPFRLAVDSAKADVARTKATVDFAMTDLQRAEPLVRTGAISDQVFDQRKASLSTAQAQLQFAQVAVRNAELNLEWSEVRAPIAGRISDRKVDVGNLIAGGEAASTTLLATIVSQDPIYFVFDISETDALRYLRLDAGGAKAAREAKNPVRVRLADEDKFVHEGTMDFLDNQLSTRSGTLRGRAVLPNPDDLFQPGLFARLQLYGGEFDALLVPDIAVVSDQASKIVFVVGPDNVVKQRPVKLGAIDNGLRVIEKGLSPDDLIVVNGIANPAVRPDAKVAPQQTQIQTATTN
jgi:RND family efflux transporter MFP subunit